MSEINIHTIQESSGRLDRYLAKQFPEYSRSQIQKWIDQGNILVNDQRVKTKYMVNQGDIVSIQEPELEVLSIDPEPIDLDIIYEDQDLIIINKPQGMVVHPSAGHHTGTLVNGLMYYTKQLSSVNGEFRPGIVHRIDKDTSGLLVVAKNDATHRYLSEQLKDKKPERTYYALVHGIIPHKEGTIKAPIGRSPKDRKKQAVVAQGRDAVTHFEVIETFGDQFSLIKCHLETGRTHQIRVHMNYIGHPIAGDPLYGPRKTLKGNGQYLHAQTLGFVHPTTQEYVTFEAPLPEYFEDQLQELRKTLTS